MKARGAEKNFHEIIARNVEGGRIPPPPPPPALLGLTMYNEWDSLLSTLPQWLYLFRLKSAFWTGQNLVYYLQVYI